MEIQMVTRILFMINAQMLFSPSDATGWKNQSMKNGFQPKYSSMTAKHKSPKPITLNTAKTAATRVVCQNFSGRSQIRSTML